MSIWVFCPYLFERVADLFFGLLFGEDGNT